MKCKNCGAPLNLNVKFCPNCGTPNEEAAKHIKDMENYGRKFNQTRNRVVGNSKWFVEYIAPLTSMVAAVVIFAVSWVASADGFGYTLADATNSSYNRRHKTQIQSKMNEYIDSGKYEEAYFANSRREWQPDFDDERGWDSFYSVMYDYNRLRRCITADFDPAQDNEYLAQNVYSGAAEAVYNIFDEYERLDRSSYRVPSQKCREAVENIISDTKLFLKAYCNLTDDDIINLPSLDRNGVLTLITGRMNDAQK